MGQGSLLRLRLFFPVRDALMGKKVPMGSDGFRKKLKNPKGEKLIWQ